MTIIAASLLLLTGPAAAQQAPYGVPSADPYVDGYPSAAERELHLWTNAVRVDPEAFIDVYPCSFDSFQPTEKEPKAPLFLDMGLAEAGRYHSQDMADNDHFAHESSDGTGFAERVSWFYDSGYVGENIAWNYADPWTAVLQGWMCSSGHRANIMADYNELGVGIVGAYYTQDFGSGTVDTSGPVAMGAHTPLVATTEADFMADWLDAAPPATLEVVVDGHQTELALTWGTELQGVYTATVALDPEPCHTYRFLWQTAAGMEGAFPAEGSYTFGEGCEDSIGWVADTYGGGLDGAGGEDGGGGTPPGTDGSGSSDRPDLGDPRLIGCATAPGTAGSGMGLAGLLLAALGLVRRRRSHR